MKARIVGALAALALAGTAATSAVRAEVKEVILGQQFGAVYLPMVLMEHLKLVEKHLEAKKMGDVKVKWAKLGGPAALNDAFLSGSLHFAAQGVPSMALIWDRTKGEIKAVAAIANNDIWLNTRNPNIKSLKDFTEKDRIAIPSLRVSTQALALQIAAEKVFGVGGHNKLDHIIVPLPHPEALAAVLNPVHEINTHFATSPFNEVELKSPNIRTVTTFFEIMGGPSTGLTWTSTSKFRSENPTVYAAVNAAYDEALALISKDKKAAGRLYLVAANDRRTSPETMDELMMGKGLEFTKVPSNVGKFVEFMHRVGTIKTKPTSWKDLFFPEIHSANGT
ncbi:MAG TPA: ABC transporter substrate-binding protein [Hyphomicrobiaceae bacterium]|nr:ABC transporter substrate-binding protein [Hyphomicrobiaceae bacterium]